MRRVLGWSVGVFILVACLAAANLRRDSAPIEVDWQLFRPSPPTVVVGHPTPGPISRTIAAKGVVEPVHQAQVVARVGGKVVEVRVEEGSSVHKGDVLIKLDDAPWRSRSDLARIRLDTAKTNLTIAEAHLRDIEKDPATATAPVTPAPAQPTPRFPGIPVPLPPSGPTRLEAARDSVDGWKRERRAADAAHDSALADLEHTTIRATIDGVIEELAVEVGDDVNASPATSLAATSRPTAPTGLMAGMGLIPSQPRADLLTGPSRPLCRILDPTELRVRAWIDEADVGLVGAEQPTRIFLPDQPDIPVAGRISKVAARGQPNGDVVSYAAMIDLTDAATDRHPRAGMRVSVEVEVSRKDAPIGVPVQAVLHRKRRDLPATASARSTSADLDESAYIKAVFVIDDNQVRLRPIETGVSDERRVEVVSGLEVGDRLVIGPFRALDTLEDGAAVRSEPGPEDVLSLTRGTPVSRGPTR